MSTTFPVKVRSYLWRCERAFVQNEQVVEALVKGCFAALPGNRNPAAVTVKVQVLNAKYRTQLGRSGPDRETVVQHIVRLAKPSLDRDLGRGLPTAVDSLAKVDGSMLFSFASKYAHFSRPMRFPMWDAFADHALKHLNDRFSFYYGVRNFKKSEFGNWCDAVTAFRHAMGGGMDFRTADHILWTFGYILKFGRKARAYTQFAGPRPLVLW